MSKDYSYTKYVNEEYVTNLARSIQQNYAEFPSTDFIKAVVPYLEELKFTQRMRFISDKLYTCLPSSYPDALNILLATLGSELQKTTGTFNEGYMYWPISCFIEDYGLDHFEESMHGIYELTKRFTGEYAIRVYLIHDLQDTLDHLRQWLDDPNPHVRRLVSEGTRPTIPWGRKIPELIDKPHLVFDILTVLNDDPEKYVQKSVANHINAISKHHPGSILDLVEGWMPATSKYTRWIIKQGLRTLGKTDARAQNLLSRLSTS